MKNGTDMCRCFDEVGSGAGMRKGKQGSTKDANPRLVVYVPLAQHFCYENAQIGTHCIAERSDQHSG